MDETMKKAIIAIVILLAVLVQTVDAGDIAFTVDALDRDGKISVNSIGLVEGKAPDYLLQPEDRKPTTYLEFDVKELCTLNFFISLYAYDLNESLNERMLQCE